jgi:hypothetical protein
MSRGYWQSTLDEAGDPVRERTARGIVRAIEAGLGQRLVVRETIDRDGVAVLQVRAYHEPGPGLIMVYEGAAGFDPDAWYRLGANWQTVAEWHDA